MRIAMDSDQLGVNHIFGDGVVYGCLYIYISFTYLPMYVIDIAICFMHLIITRIWFLLGEHVNNRIPYMEHMVKGSLGGETSVLRTLECQGQS
jgi:hypothetical protein